MPAAIPLAVAGASLAGSMISADASRSAANKQADATQSQLAEQQYQFDTVRSLLKPYVDAGTSALPSYNTASSEFQQSLGGYQEILSQLHNLTGANGSQAQQTAINGLQSNPLYTTSMGLGQQAILANASATGGLRGGNTIASLGYLPGQILSNVMQQQIGNLGTSLNGQTGMLNGLQNVINQYGNLLNLGENAAAGTGQAAMSTGNNITSLLGQQGAIGAGATLAGANAFTNGLNGVTGALGQYFGGGAGAGAGAFNFTMPAASSAAPSYMSAGGMSPAGLFGVGAGMGAGAGASGD
jgi:hypothetical protein